MINKKNIKNLLPQFIYEFLKRLYFYYLFLLDFLEFRKSNDGRFPLSWGNCYSKIYDKTSETFFDRHYIYHTAWAARKLKETNPAFHIDISSSLYFSAIASSFVPVKFFDYRPAKIELNNLIIGQADLLNLPFPDSSVKSLSCLHTIEHIGLGRYGDQIDPEGDLKAIKELTRVLAPAGNLFIAVPVGRPKLMFNAHRIYSYEMILRYFSELNLKEFCLIEENGERGLLVNAPQKIADMENYGCGCFWFMKN